MCFFTTKFRNSRRNTPNAEFARAVQLLQKLIKDLELLLADQTKEECHAEITADPQERVQQRDVLNPRVGVRGLQV